MRLGIVTTIFNRPEYIAPMLESLKTSDIPEETLIMLINDVSSDKEAIRLFDEFQFGNTVKINNDINKGLPSNLKVAFDYFTAEGCELLCTIDSDMVMKPSWFSRLFELHQQFPDDFISGFNDKLHLPYEIHDGHCFKKTMGGANIFFHKNSYHTLRPVLDVRKEWDWRFSYRAEEQGKKLVISVPSVMQHIGTVSTMGHLEISEALDYEYDNL